MLFWRELFSFPCDTLHPLVHNDRSVIEDHQAWHYPIVQKLQSSNESDMCKVSPAIVPTASYMQELTVVSLTHITDQHHTTDPTTVH
jgi:hypothetical protein